MNSISRIVSTITTIQEVVALIAGAVDQQGAATAEIAANSPMAARVTSEVAGHIVNVGGAAEAAGASAG